MVAREVIAAVTVPVILISLIAIIVLITIIFVVIRRKKTQGMAISSYLSVLFYHFTNRR